MYNFTKIFRVLVCVTAVSTSTIHAAAAQTTPTQPAWGYENRLHRNEFMSYTIRANATTGNRTDEWNYVPVENMRLDVRADGTKVYSGEVVLPEFWADRIAIIHTEGGRNTHRVYVNDRVVGSARDSGTPSEFEVRSFRAGKENTIRIEIPNDTTEPESGLPAGREDISVCYVYSQPRIRIFDFDIATELAEDGDEGRVTVTMILENDYSSTESITACFDVFSPAGKVEEFLSKSVTLAGRSRDTLSMTATIYGAGKHKWSAAKPELYTVTMFLRKAGGVLEYVAAKTGFGSTGYDSGTIYRNGSAIDLKPVRYNARDKSTLRSDIARLKKEGYNTMLPDYPQPYWFYEVCDDKGMYVIDRVNINSIHATDNPRKGGSLSNDPAWLDEYLERTEATYARTRNHPCIIGWALGGDSGNGYNMYKTYVRLHELDPLRAVIYEGVGEEWNSDITL